MYDTVLGAPVRIIVKILTYCITFADEVDILPNMVNQAKKLGDVWLFDGGRAGAHCQGSALKWPGTPVDDTGQQFLPKGFDIPDNAIKKYADATGCHYTRLQWPGNPGTQRNRALALIYSVKVPWDWIIQNDSDELWTDQAVEAIPQYLESLPTGVTNVLVRMIHLVVDEKHYWKKNHTHLVHGRITRPNTIIFEEGWHEHQNYSGQRVASDLTLLHTKHLFTKRLMRYYGKGLEMWADMDITPLPQGAFGLTWPTLVYPIEDQIK